MCGHGAGAGCSRTGARVPPAAQGLRAQLMDCVPARVCQHVLLGQQDSSSPLARTANRELVDICIHMADCTHATRLRVLVVSDAVGPLLGRIGHTLAQGNALCASPAIVLSAGFRVQGCGGQGLL